MTIDAGSFACEQESLVCHRRRGDCFRHSSESLALNLAHSCSASSGRCSPNLSGVDTTEQRAYSEDLRRGPPGPSSLASQKRPDRGFLNRSKLTLSRFSVP